MTIITYNKKTLTLLTVLSCFLAGSLAQYTYTDFRYRCTTCVNYLNATTNQNPYYCLTTGQCQTSSTAGQGCGNTMATCMERPANITYPGLVKTVDKLDIENLQSFTLRRDQTYQLIVKSQAEKSSFINITYDDYNKKNDTSRVLFYAYNQRYQPNNDKTLFEMSHVDSVLLPETEDPFVIYLAALGGDFNITVTASNSFKLFATTVASIFALIAVIA
eukprot:403332048